MRFDENYKRGLRERLLGKSISKPKTPKEKRSSFWEGKKPDTKSPFKWKWGSNVMTGNLKSALEANTRSVSAPKGRPSFLGSKPEKKVLSENKTEEKKSKLI